MEGVSTRRVDDLVRSLGCEGISKSQVSRICSELDTVVTSFLGRPLDSGPYRYLWLDALTQRVREEGRIAQVSVVVATAVNAEGKQPPRYAPAASHILPDTQGFFITLLVVEANLSLNSLRSYTTFTAPNATTRRRWAILSTVSHQASVT